MGACIFSLLSPYARELFPRLCKVVLYDVFTLGLLIFNVYSVGMSFIHVKEKEDNSWQSADLCIFQTFVK